jgi:hypothetical protein
MTPLEESSEFKLSRCRGTADLRQNGSFSYNPLFFR